VLGEQASALDGILAGLDAAELGGLVVEHHRGDVEFTAELQDVGASLCHELIGEKVAVANDDSERRFAHAAPPSYALSGL